MKVYTDDDYHEMVMDHFIGSPYVREGMTDDELIEKYHEVLAVMLDRYRWGDVLTDMKDFRFLFHELDIPGFREKDLHKYVGIFMGGTLFYTSDAGGDCLYFAICNGDTEQQGKVITARVSDPDENGRRTLLLDVNTVLECPLELTEGTAKDDEWPWRGARDVCWYCGGKLIWQKTSVMKTSMERAKEKVSSLTCIARSAAPACNMSIGKTRRKKSEIQ